MAGALTGGLRARVEASSTSLLARESTAPYAVGRFAQASGASVAVLVSGEHDVGDEVALATGHYVALPAPLDAGLALLLPPVALAMALWDMVDLEIGDAAAWTGGRPLSGLLGQVAMWRGACPGIALNVDGSAPAIEHVESVDGRDAERATRRLSDVAATGPGFAAVEVTGRAELIDILLEALPPGGRLVLAGPPGAPLTIDFYKNVHRKGAVIRSTTLEPCRIFAAGGEDLRAQLGRAVALLQQPGRAGQCASLLTTAQTS